MQSFIVTDVVIGKKEGTKVRVRYPSMTSGQIQYTFSSKEDAKKHIRDLNVWQQSRATIREV